MAELLVLATLTKLSPYSKLLCDSLRFYLHDPELYLHCHELTPLTIWGEA